MTQAMGAKEFGALNKVKRSQSSSTYSAGNQ